MTKADAFSRAGRKLQKIIEEAEQLGFGPVTDEQDEQQAAKMSDTKNWCCVHTTRFKPLFDKQGNIVIPSTAMATNGETPRNTVHTTLNHIVENNEGGNWDDCSYVILASYNSVVAKNGEPAGMDLVDTYFSTDVDTGLVLPKEDAYFIHPTSVSDGPLYTIGEHEATYKNNDFTDDEINMILSLLPSSEIEKYNKLMAGDLNVTEIKSALGTDERAKKMYEYSKAKGKESEKAFLRGIMEDKRTEILARYLRDFVTRKVMKDKGFEYIDGALDRSVKNKHVAKAVRDVAISKKIDTTGIAHAHSFYGAHALQPEFVGFKNEIEYLVSESNMDRLFTRLTSNPVYIKAVAYNDFQHLEDHYVEYEARFKRYKETMLEESARVAQEYVDEYQGTYTVAKNCENIEQFDPKFAKALKRQVATLTQKLRDWRKKMEEKPKFQKLIKKLQDFINGDYEDYNEFMKPSIEGIDVRVMHSLGNDGL